jgi:hypothetical protein
MLNKHTYSWDDEIMAECRERKAHVIEKYGGWENYMKHIDDEILRPDGTPWPKASPEDLPARNILSERCSG